MGGNSNALKQGTSELKMAAPTDGMFRAAVERILGSWTCLQLAVSHGFGGADSREKAEWMPTAVDQWFSENSHIETYEVDDFLTDVMNAEFDTIVDDGSLREISQMICGCYKLCQQGDEATLRQKLEKLPKPSLQQCVQQPSPNQDVDSDEDEDSVNRVQGQPPGQPLNQPLGAPAANEGSENKTNTEDAMETDEDGWQTVSKKGKRR